MLTTDRMKEESEKLQMLNLDLENLTSYPDVLPPSPTPKQEEQPFDISQCGSDGYFQKIFKSEAGGNVRAKNRYGSAAGPYQFIASTWKGLCKEMGVNYSLDDRYDMNKATQVMSYFTKKNDAVLRKHGLPVNNFTRYSCHLLGAGTAAKFLRMSDDTPMTAVLSVKGCQANPGLAWKNGAPTTVGFVKRWLHRRMA